MREAGRPHGEDMSTQKHHDLGGVWLVAGSMSLVAMASGLMRWWIG